MAGIVTAVAVEAVAMVAAVAEAKTAAEGAARLLAPTALATMGAGNSRGKHQSTKKRQNGGCGGSDGDSHDCGNGGSRDRGVEPTSKYVPSGGAELLNKQQFLPKIQNTLGYN